MKYANWFYLALGGLLEVALDALQVVDGCESGLQLGLELALGLVQIGAGPE